MERSTFIVDRRGRHRSTVKVDRSIGVATFAELRSAYYIGGASFAELRSACYMGRARSRFEYGQWRQPLPQHVPRARKKSAVST